MSEYFGDLGDESNEKTFIKRIVSVGWKKISYKLNEELDMVQTINCNIYSIDPVGCIDIDDAIHIKEFEDYYEIGIHIADVSYYIEENSTIDLEIQKRAESIYLPNETIHMLPENLMKLCSLTQNKLSRVVSVIFNMNKKNYKIIDYNIQRNIIKPINLSYDDASLLIKNKSNIELDLLYDIGKHLYEYQNEIYDTHKMVEKYMILANNYIAIHISSNKGYILRIHNGIHSNDSLDYVDIDNSLLKKHQIINLEKAEYVLINESYSDTMLHNILNIKYTHFTSPIRRYVDILVHRSLFKPIELDNKIIQNLNDKHSHYKKWTNYIDIYNIKNTFFETTAHIINLEPFALYIDKYDLILYHNIISDKIKDMFDMKIENNKIIITYNNDIIELKLFQQITLIISVTSNKWNKLNIHIIDPNVQFLFYDDY